MLVDLMFFEELVIGIIGDMFIDGIFGGIDVGGEIEFGIVIFGLFNMSELVDVFVVEVVLSFRFDYGKCK